MNRELFEKVKDKHIRLVLKDGFRLDGTIDEVFDSYFEFTTPQKSSYIDFDNVAMVIPLE